MIHSISMTQSFHMRKLSWSVQIIIKLLISVSAIVLMAMWSYLIYSLWQCRFETDPEECFEEDGLKQTLKLSESFLLYTFYPWVFFLWLWSGYVLANCFNDVVLFSLCFLTRLSAEGLCWDIKLKTICCLLILQHSTFFVYCSNKRLWKTEAVC